MNDPSFSDLAAPLLPTERSDPSSKDLDSLATADLLALMNRADAQIPAAISREIPRISLAIEAIADALHSGKRLFYVGCGTSGRLGVLDASECPPTFGVPSDLVQGIIAGGDRALRQAIEGAEDNPEAGAQAIESTGISSGDAVVGIAASGRTPYVLGAVRWARRIGAITAGISCNPGSLLSAEVQYPMEVVLGPEVLTGSTRLRAGTATKMVLNMISTAVMVRLGHVYGNLMVNVQPTNQKLLDRARRIVAEVTGLAPDRAADLLERAGRDVRTAIVMERRGVDREQAQRYLAQAAGRIREALTVG